MEKEITKDWFIGFIEGEGNFHVALTNTKDNIHYPFDSYPQLQFRIFLREDDKEVLEKIKEFLGFGKIYKKSLRYNRDLGFKSRDQYYLVIGNSKDLLKLKDILSDSIFFTKKKKDKELFFNILDMKLDKKHLNKEGYKEMLKLIGSLNSGERSNFKRGGNRKLYSRQ